MAKIILLTGSFVGYAYATEFFTAWYSGNPYESYVFFVSRATGPYAWAYWTMVFCNVAVPQLFWSARLRRSVPVLFLASPLARHITGASINVNGGGVLV